MNAFARRWSEIKTTWLRYPALYAVPGLVTGLAIGFLIGATMNFGMENKNINYTEIDGTSILTPRKLIKKLKKMK